MKRYFVLAGLAALLVSCSPKLLQRYEKLDSPLKDDNSDVTKGAEVLASARDVPEIVTKTQYLLTDHGQAAYINALLALKPKSVADLQSNLFPDISDPEKAPSTVDHTVFTRRLLFTVLAKTPYEADRITSLCIKVHTQPDQSKVKILTFDKITTEYQTVDLGSINQSNSLTAGLNASYGLTSQQTTTTAGNSSTTTTTNPDGSQVVTAVPVTTTSGQVSPTFGASASLSDTYTNAQQINIKNRYIALTGYIKENNITFDEQSISGVNLAGNILSDIKFTFTDKLGTDAYSISGFVKEDKKLAAAGDLKIKVFPVYEPPVSGPLTIPVDYEFTIRHVVNEDGRKTFTESDDEVIYYTVSRSTKVEMTLVDRTDLKVPQWFIGIGANSLNIRDVVLNKPGQTGTLYFTSYDNCVAFLRWLRKTKPAGLTLVSGDYELTTANGDDLKAYVNNAVVQKK